MVGQIALLDGGLEYMCWFMEMAMILNYSQKQEGMRHQRLYHANEVCCWYVEIWNQYLHVNFPFSLNCFCISCFQCFLSLPIQTLSSPNVSEEVELCSWVISKNVSLTHLQRSVKGQSGCKLACKNADKWYSYSCVLRATCLWFCARILQRPDLSLLLK